jgi:hypothetical protein
MSTQTKAKPETVRNCVQVGDGRWLVKTDKGRGGYSPDEIPEGCRVLIIDGLARRS